MTTLHLLKEKRTMLEIEAMTKITALDKEALKLLREHCISCNLDHGSGGACDYPYCKGAKRLIIKNAMSGGERELHVSLIQIVKRSEKGKPRRGFADCSSRRDDDTATITRNSGGGAGGSPSRSSFCSSWKSRSRVDTTTLMQDEEGQIDAYYNK